MWNSLIDKYVFPILVAIISSISAVMYSQYLANKDSNKHSTKKYKPKERFDTRPEKQFINTESNNNMQNMSKLNISYPVVIALAISLFVMLNSIYPDIKNWLLHNGFMWLADNYPRFVSDGDKKFITYIIGWLSVLYAILLPIVLVLTYQQFNKIEGEFDREIDTIKILSDNILLLNTANNRFKKNLLRKLLGYINHVTTKYKDEPYNNDLQSTGDKILKEIRKEYHHLFHQVTVRNKEPDPLVQELLHQLNEIVSIRGARLSLSTQRIFQSLHFISLITSIIFIVPFYFIDLRLTGDITVGSEFGLFGYLLIGAVTFLVVFILTLIEDLDEPFDGKWKITMEPWHRIKEDLSNDLEELGVKVIVTTK